MSTSKHILVVEDDPECLAALTELLSSEGYVVDIAENGADAIELFEAGQRPAVVLVDLLMPGLVGNELIEYLRTDEKLSQIPVGIVSGSPHLAPDGYPVFPKPFQLEELLDFVRMGCSSGGRNNYVAS